MLVGNYGFVSTGFEDEERLLPSGPAPSVPLVGNYGFVSNGFDDEVGLLRNIDEMMTLYHVRDVQFYDWFPNYAGIFQAFSNQTSPAIRAMPSWWTGPEWKDPWFANRTIRRDVLKKAVERVKSYGGRAWAYVQAQGSEFFNLAGAPWQCNTVNDPATATTTRVDPETVSQRPGGSSSELRYPIFENDQDVLAKLTVPRGRNRALWQCHPPHAQPGGRVIPTYFMNQPLANYQCDAWVDPVLALGFSGIHWDTMITPPHNQNIAAFWQTGAAEYLRVAKRNLAKVGLLQTFNDINLSFGITNSHEFFGARGVLEFQYTEVWSPDVEAQYYASALPGAVVANYPGSNQNGCKLPEDQGDFTNDPLHQDFYTLAQSRYLEALCGHGMRYVLVGCGSLPRDNKSALGMIVNEYFPNVTAMDKKTSDMVMNNYCGSRCRSS